MAEWKQSTCRPDVWYQGYPGQGCYYWTARFGTIWVGATWGPYSQQVFECGGLGAPVKPYGFISEKNAAGQWFEGGVIYYRNGYWVVELGNWGQTAGRLVEDEPMPDDVEQPPGHADAAPDAPEPPEDSSSDWVGKRLATDTRF